MRIFISVASPDQERAREIAMALRGDGHTVFLDSHDLPAGDSYHERIRRAIESADMMVYLVSPASVTTGRYTLSELRFAEKKWGHPKGRVLPVMVQQTPMHQVPAFLKGVSILMPEGDLSAEVAYEVGRLLQKIPGFNQQRPEAAAGSGPITRFLSGDQQAVRRTAHGDPIDQTQIWLAVGLFALLGFCVGMISYAIYQTGAKSSVSGAMMQGSVYAILFVFMCVYLEIARPSLLIAGAVALIGGFAGTKMLSRGLEMGEVVSAGVEGALCAALVVGILSLTIRSLQEPRNWMPVVALSCAGRLVATGLSREFPDLAIVASASWDAVFVGTICFVLLRIFKERQPGPGTSQRAS